MFIEFQIGNFRSFKDIQKLTMQAAPLRANDMGLEENNVFSIDNLRLLKTKAIYGSNASGKSNIAKALAMFTYMVTRSVSEEGVSERVWEDRFQLISGWDEQPMFFQYIFSLKEKMFRYGFEILKGAVLNEWLFDISKSDENNYFFRTPGDFSINDQYFTGITEYKEQVLNSENEIYRSDSLFLTGAALNGNKIATDIRNEIRRLFIIGGLDDKVAIGFAMNIMKNGTHSQQLALKALLSTADTGVEDLEISDIPEVFFKKHFSKEVQKNIKEDSEIPSALFAFHSKYDENGNFVDKVSFPFALWESDGTAKLFGIGALVLESLHTGRTLVIDEFDARFHPNLTLKIVTLFQSADTNPNNVQLIFVTHDTGLLRRADLRRDQICLIDKDKFGVSSLHTLIEYKGVRKDASYEKEYLNGNYSGVPYLDEIDSVFEQNIKKNEPREAK